MSQYHPRLSVRQESSNTGKSPPATKVLVTAIVLGLPAVAEPLCLTPAETAYLACDNLLDTLDNAILQCVNFTDEHPSHPAVPDAAGGLYFLRTLRDLILSAND